MPCPSSYANASKCADVSENALTACADSLVPGKAAADLGHQATRNTEMHSP
jgi:hypothetical protein